LPSGVWQLFFRLSYDGAPMQGITTGQKPHSPAQLMASTISAARKRFNLHQPAAADRNRSTGRARAASHGWFGNFDSLSNLPTQPPWKLFDQSSCPGCHLWTYAGRNQPHVREPTCFPLYRPALRKPFRLTPSKWLKRTRYFFFGALVFGGTPSAVTVSYTRSCRFNPT